MSSDPVKRFTLLVLWTAQRDGATELVVDPALAGAGSIRYNCEGRWHDFSPPPAGMIPAAIAELETLAGFPTGAYPKEGVIDVPFSGVRLRWLVRKEAADSPCVLTAPASLGSRA